MDELGTLLVRAREELGLSLDDVANRTMVSKKYLRALETGNYKVFPGEVYLKGALRKYAQEAGLDPGKAVELYEKIKLREMSPPETLQQEKSSAKPAPAQEAPAPKKRRLRYDRLLAILLVVALLAVLAYSITHFSKKAAEPSGPQDEPAPPGPQEEEVEEMPDPSPEPSPPKPVVESKEERGQLTITVREADGLVVSLGFQAQCWVQAYADGAMVHEQTFRAGESFGFTATGNATLRIGNPAALSLSVNGEVVEIENKANPIRVFIELL